MLTAWRKRDGILVRFNGHKNGWEVKVGGKIFKAVFANEQAAIQFGLDKYRIDESDIRTVGQ